MRFLHSQSGAVTVDWVVLTAGLVGLGLATMSVVSTGVQDTSGDVEAQLTSTTIYTSFNQRSYSDLYQAILAEEAAGLGNATVDASTLESLIADFESRSDADLLNSIASLEAKKVGFRDAQIAYLEGTAPGEITVEGFLAPREAYFGWDDTQMAANVASHTTIIDNDFGGDTAAYAAFYSAGMQRKHASLGAMQQIADDRGLSY